MPNLALSWSQGAGLAVGLAAVAVALRYPTAPSWRRLSPVAGEASVIAALYALWQLAGTLSTTGPQGAYSRGEWVLRFERGWLPSERDVQGWVLPHRWLGEFCNLYYAGVHFAALGALLLWVFVRHRDAYARLRLTTVLLTASCLLIQLVPVAPPRLLGPGYGFVDLATRYGQSVYSGTGVDELSAMPSVHVGWAVLVALTAIRVSRSRWRWLTLAHPVLTVFVVTVTANHYWLDGIVAIVLLAVAESAQTAIARAWRARAATTHPAQLQPSL